MFYFTEIMYARLFYGSKPYCRLSVAIGSLSDDSISPADIAIIPSVKLNESDYEEFDDKVISDVDNIKDVAATMQVFEHKKEEEEEKDEEILISKQKSTSQNGRHIFFWRDAI
jgi:hypothetical protein